MEVKISQAEEEIIKKKFFSLSQKGSTNTESSTAQIDTRG